MKTLDAIVHAISVASATSRSHELRAATGAALPSFEADAHIDGRLGPSLIRQYSLCNSPQDDGRYLICVRRDDAGRGGSGTLHRDLTAGRRLRIPPPRNHFPLAPPAVDGRSTGRAGSSVRRHRADRRTAGLGTGHSRPCLRARRLHGPRHGQGWGPQPAGGPAGRTPNAPPRQFRYLPGAKSPPNPPYGPRAPASAAPFLPTALSPMASPPRASRSHSPASRASAASVRPPSWPVNPTTTTRSGPRTSAQPTTGSPSAAPVPAPPTPPRPLTWDL